MSNFAAARLVAAAFAFAALSTTAFAAASDADAALKLNIARGMDFNTYSPVSPYADPMTARRSTNDDAFIAQSVRREVQFSTSIVR